MGSIHPMPPDTREKEKIIGGLLNINQFGFICAGLVICAIITSVFFRILGIFSLFVGLIFVIIGLVFAFKRVEEFTLFNYLRYKRRFNKKAKYYINAGFHDDLEFTADEEEV